MLLTELAAKLAADGLVASGFTVMRGILPDSPDAVIVLYEYGGFGPDVFLGDDAPVENTAVQVVTRGAPLDYDTPRAAIEAIYQAMLTWGAFTASGTRYLSVQAQQSPFFFRRDENERVHFAVNVLFRKELSAA